MTASTIDRAASVHPDAYVAPGAVVCAGVTIGAGSVVGPGSVIGRPGFGYRWDADGDRWERKEHAYGVLIGRNVRIGANCVVDAGSWRPTTIEDGAKLDSTVFVAHNAVVGRNCLLIAGCRLGGSVRLGERVFVGLGATIIERVTVGARTVVGAGAVVIRKPDDWVSQDSRLVGNPARLVPGGGIDALLEAWES